VDPKGEVHEIWPEIFLDNSAFSKKKYIGQQEQKSPKPEKLRRFLNIKFLLEIAENGGKMVKKGIKHGKSYKIRKIHKTLF
jgi:hypothetical protein